MVFFFRLINMWVSAFTAFISKTPSVISSIEHQIYYHQLLCARAYQDYKQSSRQ
uniref:Bm1619 n=1 Tax=Brugia malayi TaxID=6279 RepID=A0A1I9G3D1_BRUMA|nr:Bm1619 [Brugia malayi]